MPPFQPFPGIRYDSRFALADVTAPPYDVIDAATRARLVDRSDRNVVILDLPLESDGDGRYRQAATTFDAWRHQGVLVIDDRPTLTVYRMTFTDDRGRPARTLGVIGALELSRPYEGHILPHEHTTKKAKTDRLDLQRATCANLSPVWVLSLTEGLTALLEPAGEPDAAWTDEDGVGHATWRLDDPDHLAAITTAVGRTPVVVADGHHRYETALAHRDERRAAAAPDTTLDSDALMALVVELSPRELHVHPIHRLVDGMAAAELQAALAPRFAALPEVVPAPAVASAAVLEHMDRAGALALVHPDGSAVLLRPRPGAFAGVADLDSARTAAALAPLPGVAVRYQHGADLVQAAVVAGEAGAGLLLRPATVAQIQANAHAGERMPPKTTFFHPKPRTGVVFRAC